MKSKNSIILILPIVIFFSCIQSKLKREFSTLPTFDSVCINFKENKSSDCLIFKQKEKSILLGIYYNNSKYPNTITQKVVFNFGDIRSDNMEYLYINNKNNHIILTQEYGASNPDGWYSIYISSQRRKFYVDSIQHEKRVYNTDSISSVIKTKVINQPLEEFSIREQIPTLKI